MSARAATLPGRDGQWVDDWLSGERLSTYLFAATGSRTKALALYEWNSEVAAAVHTDLCHLEIGLRNAYDNALRTHWQGSADWTASPHAMFPPTWRNRGGRGTGKPKARVDVNRKPRELLVKARVDAGGPTVTSGKVIAELSFGFWRYMTTAVHEKQLWVPYLHHAFPAGTDRSKDVDVRIERIHKLRNRVAHHEPLLRTNLSVSLTDIIDLATLISSDLGAYIDTTTSLRDVLTRRP